MNTFAPNRFPARQQGRHGYLLMDMAAAICIFMLAILPLAYSFGQATHALRAEYQRAVAMEIVDGEMEFLAAGGWRSFPDGTQDYPVHASSAANLPSGKFQLTKNGNHLRLEWKSAAPRGVGAVVREVNIK
jgi:hypothetical protein